MPGTRFQSSLSAFHRWIWASTIKRLRPDWATPVLRYSKFIHAIEPPDGRQTMDGMARILPSQVLARIEPHLAAKLISS